MDAVFNWEEGAPSPAPAITRAPTQRSPENATQNKITHAVPAAINAKQSKATPEIRKSIQKRRTPKLPSFIAPHQSQTPADLITQGNIFIPDASIPGVDIYGFEKITPLEPFRACVNDLIEEVSHNYYSRNLIFSFAILNIECAGREVTVVVVEVMPPTIHATQKEKEKIEKRNVAARRLLKHKAITCANNFPRLAFFHNIIQSNECTFKNIATMTRNALVQQNNHARNLETATTANITVYSTLVLDVDRFVKHKQYIYTHTQDAYNKYMLSKSRG
jgi:hypothetical protein